MMKILSNDNITPLEGAYICIHFSYFFQFQDKYELIGYTAYRIRHDQFWYYAYHRYGSVNMKYVSSSDLIDDINNI